MVEYNVEYHIQHLPPYYHKVVVAHQSMSLEQLLPAAVVYEAISFCMSPKETAALISISIGTCWLSTITITWKADLMLS